MTKLIGYMVWSVIMPVRDGLVLRGASIQCRSTRKTR